VILHKLLWRYFRQGPDEEFYRLQAVDTVGWLLRHGLARPGSSAVDLGCGHGVLGRELERAGVAVAYLDKDNLLLDRSRPFYELDLDEDAYTSVPKSDLVVCSNVLEHLARPKLFFSQVHGLVNPGGHIYLSWTNWLSPFGGHDWAPFHYLGARLGPRAY
jgi:2-polyprenyl-3-methyl-5-hydroxy-6-metoxy-1,4-benzoquinol methylase